ncbi:hypothetical protein V498_01026 [Pseudogymnoascus sp. VKM F-4517 (FW-2822)]|nr:hypothetical protein V498_01026 [Pseudogymnoascus sp. VKM F-4517 (FW-2822)]
MTSRTRIDQFDGTDSEYIAYLESKVLQLSIIRCSPPPRSKAHRLTTNHSPPPSPPSEVRELTTNRSPPKFSRSEVGGDEAIDSSEGDEVLSDTLEIILYNPSQDCLSHNPAKKRQRIQTRWEHEMDGMLSDIPNAKDWSPKRKSVGLASSAKILVALDVIIHGRGPQMDLNTGQTDLSVVCYDRSNAVLQLLNTFAITTAALQIETTFTRQIYRFRVFVFVSLCCVALHHGVEKKFVEEAMQRCVSDSCGKNLTRLRNGALWVNQMMSTLAADGRGHRAYELFVLCGRSIACYGRFAQTGESGFSYFRSRVPICEQGREIQASLPFWVPFIIKSIVGEVYSLSDICIALGYGADSQIHHYPRYLQNYHSRRIPLPPNVHPEITATSIGHSRTDGLAGCGGGGEGETRTNSNSILDLLTAAEYSHGYLPVLVPEQQPLLGRDLVNGKPNSAPLQPVTTGGTALYTMERPMEKRRRSTLPQVEHQHSTSSQAPSNRRMRGNSAEQEAQLSQSLPETNLASTDASLLDVINSSENPNSSTGNAQSIENQIMNQASAPTTTPGPLDSQQFEPRRVSEGAGIASMAMDSSGFSNLPWPSSDLTSNNNIANDGSAFPFDFDSSHYLSNFSFNYSDAHLLSNITFQYDPDYDMTSIPFPSSSNT